MRPISDLDQAVARAVCGVFTDIDGTLTLGNKLMPEAYAALWKLARAGLRVIPVTGRPAGWCDHLARHWPIAAVIGENGALAFYEREGGINRLFHPDAAAPEVRARLDEVRQAILAEVAGSRVAKDQSFRLFDLAIDFCEEAPDLGLPAAMQIRDIFTRHGAHAKISSIHVNGWFGAYDKLAMARLLSAELWGEDLDQHAERYLFCGDSPNDEPMFAFFPNACGVANIAAFAGQLRHLPRFVSSKPGGAGFAEIVDVLLARRA